MSLPQMTTYCNKLQLAEESEPPRVIAKAIPEALRRVPQWVLWKYELRDGRITKVPYTVFGTRASVNDPDTVAPVLRDG